MAVKTITIDLEAYGLLVRYKRPGQSFSQVIKAQLQPTPTVEQFRANLRSIRLSAQALEGMERQVRRRHTEPARAAGR